MVKQIENPYEIILIDSDSLITIEDVENTLANRKSVTLCIRTKTGDPNRGGYFVSGIIDNKTFSLRNFDGKELTSSSEREIALLSFDELVRFINHVSGRQYDEEMYELCSNHLNFRSD